LRNAKQGWYEGIIERIGGDQFCNLNIQQADANGNKKYMRRLKRWEGDKCRIE
jgi:hypothetical protein